MREPTTIVVVVGALSISHVYECVHLFKYIKIYMYIIIFSNKNYNNHNHNFINKKEKILYAIYFYLFLNYI